MPGGMSVTEKYLETRCGKIRYQVSEPVIKEELTLVLLPGLTADHRLFEAQIRHFEQTANLLVWDAPGHCNSRPFTFDFDLEDKARWLGEILEKEAIENFVLVGQSMGAYVSQMFLELFPGRAKGFVSIDSAPLQRQYYTGIELWLLERMEPMYKMYSWNALVRDGANGVAFTREGRACMREMMLTYSDDPSYYAKLTGHGYRILVKAVRENRPYRIECPALLICGEKDQAGSTRRYNRKWHEKTGLPIRWIPEAGHNSNTDQQELVNRLIEEFCNSITQ